MRYCRKAGAFFLLLSVCILALGSPGFCGIVYGADLVQGNKDTQVTFVGGAEKFVAPQKNWVDFSMMDPGEEREQTVMLHNTSKQEMNFYFSAGIGDNIAVVEEEPEQKMVQNQKSSQGCFYDLSARTEGAVLFDERIDAQTPSGIVGKENDLGTLKPGESRQVTIRLALDGTTMTNEYQGAQGTITLSFLAKPKSQPVVTRITKTKTVKTGDQTVLKFLRFLLPACMALAAISFVLVQRAFASYKENSHKSKKGNIS